MPWFLNECMGLWLASRFKVWNEIPRVKKKIFGVFFSKCIDSYFNFKWTFGDEHQKFHVFAMCLVNCKEIFFDCSG